MKRLIHCLFIFFLISNVYSQEIPCYKRKKICPQNNALDCRNQVSFDPESSIYFVKNNFGMTYSGTCIVCHRNGVLQEEITILDGKRDGADTSYYPSGCPQSVQSFVLGKLHGKSVVFYDSTNRISKEITHYNNVVDGPYILFENNKNSDTTYMENYAMGKLDGAKVEYFEKSQRYKAVHYKNGNLHGSHITYSNSGKPLTEYEYSNGLKHGEWTIYYENNQIARRENWNEGMKNGTFFNVNRYKDTIDFSSFKNDLKHGFFMRKNNSKDTSYFQVYYKDELLYSYSKNEFGEKTVEKDLEKKTAKIITKKKDIREQLPSKFVDQTKQNLKAKKYKKKKKKKSKKKQEESTNSTNSKEVEENP